MSGEATLCYNRVRGSGRAHKTVPRLGHSVLLEFVLRGESGVENKHTIHLACQLNETNCVRSGYDVRGEVNRTVLRPLVRTSVSCNDTLSLLLTRSLGIQMPLESVSPLISTSSWPRRGHLVCIRHSIDANSSGDVSGCCRTASSTSVTCRHNKWNAMCEAEELRNVNSIATSSGQYALKGFASLTPVMCRGSHLLVDFIRYIKCLWIRFSNLRKTEPR